MEIPLPCWFSGMFFRNYFSMVERDAILLTGLFRPVYFYGV